MGVSMTNNSFKNNRIKFANSTNIPAISMFKMDDCIIDSQSLKDVTFKVYKFSRCVFNNLNINVQTPNDRTLSEKVSMDNCEYSNSILKNLILATKDRKLIVSKSKFIDTVVQVGNINTPGFPSTTILEDCNLSANIISNLFLTDFNQPNGLIKLNKCNVEISNPNFTSLIKLGQTVVPPVVTLILLDCDFKYTGGTTPLKLIYYTSTRPMIKFISADNMFTNITLPVPDTGIYLDYDPEKEYKQNVTLQPDGTTNSATISHNLNTLEPYVFCISNSTIIYPVVTIVDPNTIIVKHSNSINLNVSIKKL